MRKKTNTQTHNPNNESNNDENLLTAASTRGLGCFRSQKNSCASQRHSAREQHTALEYRERERARTVTAASPWFPAARPGRSCSTRAATGTAPAGAARARGARCAARAARDPRCPQRSFRAASCGRRGPARGPQRATRPLRHKQRTSNNTQVSQKSIQSYQTLIALLYASRPHEVTARRPPPPPVHPPRLHAARVCCVSRFRRLGSPSHISGFGSRTYDSVERHWD